MTILSLSPDIRDSRSNQKQNATLKQIRLKTETDIFEKVFALEF